MAKVIQNIDGTQQTSFQIGGLTGQKIITNSQKLKATLADGTTATEFEFKQGIDDGDGAIVLNVKERTPLIEFAADPASYVIGTNTGKYGVITVAGSLDTIPFSIGDIILDGATGAVRRIIPYKGFTIAMKEGLSASGTGLSLVANGFYTAESATTPYTYVAKGDGTGVVLTGVAKQIKIPITTAATVSSTSIIPDGAIVTAVETVITTAYSATATVTIYAQGSTPITLQTAPATFVTAAVTGSNAFTSYPNQAIGATGTGVVKIDIANTPAAGAGYVIVSYVDTFLG